MPSLRLNQNIFELQPLEIRRLLTTAVIDDTDGHRLHIIGTGSSETITVNRNNAGRITVSGVGTEFNIGSGAGQINRILVEASGGNDTILLTNNVRFPATNGGIPSTLAGGTGNDTITGGPGNDILSGNDGNDMLDGGGGNDEFTGGNNFDTANYSTRGGAIDVDIDNVADDGEGAVGENDNVTTSMEEVIGGSGNDTLVGSGNADYFGGGGGNDSMSGGNGNDQLTGSAGQDKFFGQNGNDFLVAQNSDQDTVNGGTNSDGTADTDLASIDVIDVAGAAAFTQALAAAAAASSLDPTYDGDGIAQLSLPEFNPVTGVDLQGRAVFIYNQFGQNGGGGSGNDVIVRRLAADGSLDGDFGAPLIDTSETADIGSGYNIDDSPIAVSFGADGAAFILIRRSLFESNRGFAVAKLTPAGVLDDNFGGGDGIAVFGGNTSLTGAPDFMQAIAVQGDGKVLVAGGVLETQSTGTDFIVARLTADGLLDNAANSPTGNFNTTGYNQVNLSNSDSFDSELANDIALQKLSSDSGAESVVLAGTTDSQGAILRFNADGTLDTGFGTGGAVIDSVGQFTEFRRVAVTPSGAIFVAGTETTQVIINSTDGPTVSSPTQSPGAGTFDFVARYGTNGADSNAVVYDTATISDLSADAQSRVLAVGESSGDFYLVRYSDALQPDGAFAEGGFVTIDANAGNFDGATSVRILASGKIVAGGWGLDGSESPLGIAIRLGGDGVVQPPPNTEGDVTEVEEFIDYDAIHDPNTNLFDGVSAPARFYTLSQPDGDGVARVDIPPELDKANVVKVYNVMAGDGQINVAVDVDGLVMYYDPDDTTRIEIYTKQFNDSVTADNNVAVPLLIDAGEGNDNVTGGGKNDVILAGSGNDYVNGNNGDDVEVGGDGNDNLLGWLGNDIIIGGRGSDLMFGYFGDNIMIAGFTSHDTNVDALDALMAEWSSGAPSATRVNHIRNGGGLNDPYQLRVGVGATVFDDGASDYLTLGGTGDWAFYKQNGPNRDFLLAGNPSIKDLL